VLYQRLKDLRQAGLVTQVEQERYELTPLGLALGEAIEPLNRWSRTWATEWGVRQERCE
jgi:DNA-binding HxlR family transcriptional regulator